MKKIFFTLWWTIITVLAFPQWHWQNPLPQGNSLESVFFTDSNTGYAVGDAGTILKTTNGGLTWTTLTIGIPTVLNSVFFTDNNTGYAVGYNGTNGTGSIIKTNDGGTTWNFLSSGTNMQLNSVFFTSPDTGYVCGEWGTLSIPVKVYHLFRSKVYHLNRGGFADQIY